MADNSPLAWALTLEEMEDWAKPVPASPAMPANRKLDTLMLK